MSVSPESVVKEALKVASSLPSYQIITRTEESGGQKELMTGYLTTVTKIGALANAIGVNTSALDRRIPSLCRPQYELTKKQIGNVISSSGQGGVIDTKFKVVHGTVVDHYPEPTHADKINQFIIRNHANPSFFSYYDGCKIPELHTNYLQNNPNYYYPESDINIMDWTIAFSDPHQTAGLVQSYTAFDQPKELNEQGQQIFDTFGDTLIETNPLASMITIWQLCCRQGNLLMSETYQNKFNQALKSKKLLYDDREFGERLWRSSWQMNVQQDDKIAIDTALEILQIEDRDNSYHFPVANIGNLLAQSGVDQTLLDFMKQLSSKQPHLEYWLYNKIIGNCQKPESLEKLVRNRKSAILSPIVDFHRMRLGLLSEDNFYNSVTNAEDNFGLQFAKDYVLDFHLPSRSIYINTEKIQPLFRNLVEQEGPNLAVKLYQKVTAQNHLYFGIYPPISVDRQILGELFANIKDRVPSNTERLELFTSLAEVAVMGELGRKL